MALDSSLYVRQAVVATLKNFAPVTAIVADRIYGPNPIANAVWPFVRCGFPIVTPYLASCLDGALVGFALHGFAKGDDETVVLDLGAALAASIADKALFLRAPYPATAYVRWTHSQLVRDSAEASAWHAIVQFEATVTS